MARAPRVYLDYNATAPLRPAARAAMLAAMDGIGNPSSVHGEGRAARALIEQARAQVAALVGARAPDVIFTSGATEANNIVARCSGAHWVSAIEHDSLLAPAVAAQLLPVTGTGVLNLAALEQLLAMEPAPGVVSIMLANNETGVIQPVAEAAALIRPTGALLHVDAAQAAGKIPVDVTALGADLLSISAHKLGGPPGCGALIVRPGLEPPTLMRGGGQERRRRAGTENIVGIAGFGAAAAASADGLGAEQARCAGLRDGFEAVARATSQHAVIYGADAPRLPGTSCIGLAATPSATQLMHFDLAGVAVSAGAACSSGKVAASHVLLAMGAEPAAAGRAVRVSFGWNSSTADADQLTAAWATLAARDAGRRVDSRGAA